jgi:hypothetical protein
MRVVPIVRPQRPVLGRVRPAQVKKPVAQTPEPPLIQLTQFMGRFGNQVGQYSLARSMADKLNVKLETPDWIGRKIFTGVDGPITVPNKNLKVLPQEAIPTQVNAAFYGYYQYQGAFDQMSQAKLRSWLTVRPELMALCPKPRPYYIACHVRKGDYVKHQDVYAVVENICFKNALKQYGYDEADVIWLTEEDPQPGTKLMPAGMDFMYDFMILMQADVVFRSNSTFSFWGAALGGCQKVYSPLVGDKVGIREDIEFVAGNQSANFHPKYHRGLLHSDMILPA